MASSIEQELFKQFEEQQEKSIKKSKKRKERVFSEFEELAETLRGSTEDVLDRQQEEGLDFFNRFRTQNISSREKLAQLLSEERETAFDESQPQILEGLEGRGLLHSSDVGRAFAKEKGRLQTASDRILRGQALEDQGFEQNIMAQLLSGRFGTQQNLLGQEFGLQQQALGRTQDIEDFREEQRIASDLARKQRRTSTQNAFLGGFGTLSGFGISRL